MTATRSAGGARGPDDGERAASRVGREISLADLVIAFDALRPADDDERRAIARALGFALPEGKAEGVEDRGGDQLGDTPAAPAASLTPAPARATQPSMPPASADEPATEIVRMPDVVHLAVKLPEPLPPPPRTQVRIAAASLFAPDWAGVALARLGARLARTGAIDVPRLVEAVARRAAIREVPRRLRVETAPAITVVLDRSGEMAWLAGDQARLVAQLDAVLPVPVEVVMSSGPPSVIEPIAAPRRDDRPPSGEARPQAKAATRRPSVRAAHGSRVIVISDLGAGSPWGEPDARTIQRWLAFAGDVEARGASLVVLTPVPPARVPAALRALPYLHWDRRTAPSRVHALIKGLR